jgi:hypothetical protein
MGVQLAWMLESMEFAKTAHALDRNLTQVTVMNIQAQYRVFWTGWLRRLPASLNEVKELNSKALTRTFMIKSDLYRNIEMVLHTICVGCIKLSAESVAESMISKYNIIFRTMSSDVFLKKLLTWKCL